MGKPAINRLEQSARARAFVIPDNWNCTVANRIGSWSISTSRFHPLTGDYHQWSDGAGVHLVHRRKVVRYVAARGRQYRLAIGVIYVGGTLPLDARTALDAMLRAGAADDWADLTLDVSADAYSVMTVRCTMRGTSPRDVLIRLDVALDEALRATGLFEEFDVSGKTLRAAPEGGGGLA